MAHGGWTDTRTKVGGRRHLQLPRAPCRQVSSYPVRGHPLLLPQVWVRSGSGGEKHLAGDYILIRGAGRGPAPGDALLLAVSVGRCQIWAQQPVGISWSAADLSLESWGPRPPACPETTTAPAETNRELKLTQEAPSWAWPWCWLCLDPQEHAHHPSSDPAGT